jgi:hypothetical protein
MQLPADQVPQLGDLGPPAKIILGERDQEVLLVVDRPQHLVGTSELNIRLSGLSGSGAGLEAVWKDIHPTSGGDPILVPLPGSLADQGHYALGMRGSGPDGNYDDKFTWFHLLIETRSDGSR